MRLEWERGRKRPRQYSYILKFIGLFSNRLEEETQVRLRTAVLAFVVGIAVFLTGVLASRPVSAIPAASIRILFDFGDGSYVWAAEPIGDPLATNATWHAVQSAASSNRTQEFRGDLSNSGVAGYAAPDSIQVVWDRDTGKREIGSTPAVADGRVFVTTMGWTVALDAVTGQILWNTSKARGFSSPAVFNNSVFVGTSNGTVVRLNLTDGALLWETRLLASTSFSGITSSPKVAYDRVFVGTFNETGGPGEAVALWEGNGSVAWRHPTGSIHYSSPAYSDGSVYVGVMGRYNTTSQVSFDPPYGVLSLDAATGQERWFFPTGGSVAASPAVAGPNLIAPAKDGTVYSLNRSTGALAWEASVDAGISSPAVFGDTVFVGGGSFGRPGRVVALSLVNGYLKWSFTPNGPVQSSITYAGGRVVFATNEDNGTVYALNAETGVPVWSFEPSPRDYILGSPVVADGVVYAPSDNGHVYALGPAGLDQNPQGSPGVVLIGGGILGAGILVGAVWILVRRRSRSGP
ncbi:MAG: hypothetical protein E6K15_07760 [Methanobacteriota archaeon]|nr:MAG: hypothetical protein E6K15_07760 [Euryarchaeota archaeon]